MVPTTINFPQKFVELPRIHRKLLFLPMLLFSQLTRYFYSSCMLTYFPCRINRVGLTFLSVSPKLAIFARPATSERRAGPLRASSLAGARRDAASNGGTPLAVARPASPREFHCLCCVCKEMSAIRYTRGPLGGHPGRICSRRRCRDRSARVFRRAHRPQPSLSPQLQPCSPPPLSPRSCWPPPPPPPAPRHPTPVSRLQEL